MITAIKIRTELPRINGNVSMATVAWKVNPEITILPDGRQVWWDGFNTRWTPVLAVRTAPSYPALIQLLIDEGEINADGASLEVEA